MPQGNVSTKPNMRNTQIKAKRMLRYTRKSFPWIMLLLSAAVSGRLLAADQTIAGAGNQRAMKISRQSPMIQSAHALLLKETNQIRNVKVRNATLDAISSPSTCVAHRAGLTSEEKKLVITKLLQAGLLDPEDGPRFPGGLEAGVFPPLNNEGSKCLTLTQHFDSAPGSSFGSHHSYPGGLAVHEAFNVLSAISLAKEYREVYGHLDAKGLPILTPDSSGRPSGIAIDDDIVIAAPIWHDWAKTIVFQWNADGTEFEELSIGGNGKTDNYGAPGNSKTGAHHILGIAESIARGMPPALILAQASAHSAPTMGNEYKVVNWIRAAAIIARLDPVGAGLLRVDSAGSLRLPAKGGATRTSEGRDNQIYFFVEEIIHNLSDTNYTFAFPAVAQAEAILRPVASRFGYGNVDVATYNNGFRNPVLSFISAERLVLIYDDGGEEAVAREVGRLGDVGVLHAGER